MKYGYITYANSKTYEPYDVAFFETKKERDRIYLEEKFSLETDYAFNKNFYEKLDIPFVGKLAHSARFQMYKITITEQETIGGN